MVLLTITKHFRFCHFRYKLYSDLRNLSLQKEENFLEVLMEVDESLQLYTACLNKQKSQK